MQPCLCDWVIKGLGMSSRVCVTGSSKALVCPAVSSQPARCDWVIKSICLGMLPRHPHIPKGGTKLLKGGTKLLKGGTKLLKGGTKLLQNC